VHLDCPALLNWAACANVESPLRRPVPCAAVVVLSPAFVRDKHRMRELQILLERRAEDPGSIAILPVLIGRSVQQCGDLGARYLSQPWPQGVPEPTAQERAAALEEWAAAIKQLLQLPVATSEEVRNDGVTRYDHCKDLSDRWYQFCSIDWWHRFCSIVAYVLT
jgi:hypothetical protein